MTDDLVKRLRQNITNGWPDDVDLQACNEAADRIETLEAALSHIYAWYPISVTQPRQTIDDMREFARATLAGEKKE